MAGNPTTFDYGAIDGPPGARGNLLWVRDAMHQPDGTAFTYQYNQYGQKISETNLDGVVTEYNYDDQWGNLTSVVQDPTPTPGDNLQHLNRTTIMQYDAAGRVTYRWDPNNSAHYPDTSYAAGVTYNAVGQPAQAFFPATACTPSETVVCTYGANGRLESTTDARGTTTLQYEDQLYPSLTDLGDRVAAVTDPITGTISYTYTGRGAVATKTLPDLTTLHYSYSDDGDPYGPTMGYMEVLDKDDPNTFHDTLYQITDDSGRVLCWHNYDGYGGDMFDINSANGILSACAVQRYVDYDVLNPGTAWHTRGRLMRTVNRFYPQYDTWEILWPQQNTVSSENDYTYDSVGNRLANTVTDQNGNSRTETYGYNALSRLTSVSYGDGGSGCYTYDTMGNRISDQPPVRRTISITMRTCSRCSTARTTPTTPTATGFLTACEATPGTVRTGWYRAPTARQTAPLSTALTVCGGGALSMVSPPTMFSMART